jgi:hypothetical protein
MSLPNLIAYPVWQKMRQFLVDDAMLQTNEHQCTGMITLRMFNQADMITCWICIHERLPGKASQICRRYFLPERRMQTQRQHFQ